MMVLPLRWVMRWLAAAKSVQVEIVLDKVFLIASYSDERLALSSVWRQRSLASPNSLRLIKSFSSLIGPGKAMAVPSLLSSWPLTRL